VKNWNFRVYWTTRFRGYCRRLTADLSLSYSPAVARLDAMRNKATTALFRIVTAEAGGIAAHEAEAAKASGPYGRLNQADGRQCDHGYDRFPHRASLHAGAPLKYDTFAAGLFGGRIYLSR
jgi:hypothetical protein